MLSSFEDILLFWRENKIPIYFVSPTSFNLLGMDEFVGHLNFITYIDTFDSAHPKIIVPKLSGPPVFNHLEEINHFLLSNKKIVDLLKINSKNLDTKTQLSQILFLFFDQKLEALCKDLNLKIALPKFKEVQDVDSKIITTRIASNAGVNSVPNVISKVKNYKHLKELAKKHNLGEQLVIQSAYGDSGKTTFFISNSNDYNNYSSVIENEDEVKIMKKIKCVSTAIEACTTNQGVFVGPMMRELIGIKALTPYSGGWCGNDLHQKGFSKEIRKQAMVMTTKIGEALYKRGYRGYFEVDYLLDMDTNNLYLGELNPRFSGVTAMTNLSPHSQNTLPLFLFHLLEFLKIPFTLNSEKFNTLTLNEGAAGETSQLIMKYTKTELKVITTAPISGIYTLENNGTLKLVKKSTNRLDAKKEDEIFIMRIMSENEYIYKGADMAIVFLNTVLLGKRLGLRPKARRWITAVKNAFVLRELTSEEKNLVERYQHPGGLIKGDT